MEEKDAAIVGRKVNVVFDTSKPDGSLRKSADVTKLRKVIQGFSPQITLDEGLEDMVEHFQEKYLHAK